MGSTHYLVNSILNHLLNISTFEAPEHLYLALGSRMTGLEQLQDGVWNDELQGKGYRRIKLCPMEPCIQAADAGMQNRTWLRFPRATETWDTVGGWAVYDAEEGGNLFFFLSINPPLSVHAGQCLAVPPRQMSFEYDCASSPWLAALENDPFIYRVGAWIGEKVMKLVFQGIGFSPPPLEIAIHPAPGDGYAPVPYSGPWSSAPIAQNEMDILFPIAKSVWNYGHAVSIQRDDANWVVGEDNSSAFVPKGDQGVIPAGNITIKAIAGISY